MFTIHNWIKFVHNIFLISIYNNIIRSYTTWLLTIILNRPNLCSTYFCTHHNHKYIINVLNSHWKLGHGENHPVYVILIFAQTTLGIFKLNKRPVKFKFRILQGLCRRVCWEGFWIDSNKRKKENKKQVK